MSNLSSALRDSATMLRRDAQHSLRNLWVILSSILGSIIMLVLFISLFGGARGVGPGGLARSGTSINSLVLGIIIMTVGSGCSATALNLCADPIEDIIPRFRTMAIARASVLTSHVLGSLVRIMARVCFVIGVALLMD